VLGLILAERTGSFALWAWNLPPALPVPLHDLALAQLLPNGTRTPEASAAVLPLSPGYALMPVSPQGEVRLQFRNREFGLASAEQSVAVPLTTPPLALLEAQLLPGLLQVNVPLSAAACSLLNVAFWELTATRLGQAVPLPAPLLLQNVSDPCGRSVKLLLASPLLGAFLLRVSAVLTNGTRAAVAGSLLDASGPSDLSWPLHLASFGPLGASTIATAFRVDQVALTALLSQRNLSLATLLTPARCQDLQWELTAAPATDLNNVVAMQRLPLFGCDVFGLRHATLSGLPPFTNLTITLRLLLNNSSEAVLGHLSESVFMPPATPLPVEALRTARVGNTSLQLQWHYTVVHWRGPPGVFRVRLALASPPLGSNASALGEFLTANLTLEVGGLAPFTAYTLAVTPVGQCALCTGPPQELNITTLPGLPDAPSAVQTLALGPDSAFVSWTAPATFRGPPIAIDVTATDHSLSRCRICISCAFVLRPPPLPARSRVGFHRGMDGVGGFQCPTGLASA
jgi:hypothetical protein